MAKQKEILHTLNRLHAAPVALLVNFSVSVPLYCACRNPFFFFFFFFFFFCVLFFFFFFFFKVLLVAFFGV